MDLSSPKTEKKGNAEYFDDNTHRCIIKVYSHQLEETKGVNQATTPRHMKIVPNLALTNANHHTDKAAEKAMKCNLDDIKGFPKEIPYNLLLPHSNLKFSLTWNKKTIGFIRKLELEHLKRWKQKEVQGLLPRIIGYSFAGPEEINNSRGWKRVLLGKSNTHTRCMCLNTVIRQSVVEDTFLNSTLIKDPDLSSCRFRLGCYCFNLADTGVLPVIFLLLNF